MRHNEIRDLTASLLSEVGHDVRVEPHLQPLSGETMRYRTANTDAEARSDISACGFWGSRFEKVYMDVWCVNLTFIDVICCMVLVLYVFNTDFCNSRIVVT